MHVDSVFYMYLGRGSNAKLQLYPFHSPGSFATHKFVARLMSMSPSCGCSPQCIFVSNLSVSCHDVWELPLFHSIGWSLDLSLIKVKWTPSAGNTLLLSKGNGWQEGLYQKPEIHRFPQTPVKYIIHRDRLRKSDVLHLFWEQVGGNNPAECLCVST